jgi:ribosomal protein S18 acetylase RimI-like enzyme
LIRIHSDVSTFSLPDIRGMLSGSYWTPGITEGEIAKGMANSALNAGAFTADGRQVGYLRVISDKVRFAYLLDVIVHPEFRERGIGRDMVRFALEHPDLREVYQWILVTRDAHGVYEKCGFEPMRFPERWMSIIRPRPDRSQYPDSPAPGSTPEPNSITRGDG